METTSATDESDAKAKRTVAPGRRRRRKLMVYVALILLAAILVYGIFIEPYWLAVRTISLANANPRRVVHFSDIHYRGNDRYLQRVVELANAQRPDLICITGDFVASAGHLSGALEVLSGLASPVFAVSGNWDDWTKADLAQIADFCERSGGRLLSGETVVVAEQDLAISGGVGRDLERLDGAAADKHLVLLHYPLLVERIKGQQFDLILAGHSHGGQVRLPLIGSIVVPYDVGRYDLGLFDTPAGPLYVTSGIGTSAFPLRLNCRPEIAVIEF